MLRSHSTQSLLLAVAGVLALVHPSVVLSFTTPQPYETEILRWVGLALIGVASIRPWALRVGGDAAQRMRRWTGMAASAAALYAMTAHPLFLLLALAGFIAAALDATVERMTRAANEMLMRLREEAGQ